MVKNVQTQEYFFCANRYAKTLTANFLSFASLAEYFSKPIIASTKDATGIFPGHYTAPYRELQNIDYHTLLILDIDKHEESEKLINLVRTRDERLYQFNFIIYSTFSSTKTNLRVRLIIEIRADPTSTTNPLISIDDYPAATSTIEQLLGLSADKCSHKRNSFVYTPRIKPDSEYIFISSLIGRPFTYNDIDPAQYAIIAKSLDTSQTLISKTYDPEEIPGETLEAMLSAISADCDYDTWIKILSSLHHYSGGADWGRDIANKWSASCVNRYCGFSALADKWESIHDTTDRPVTIGTLIYIANKNDWRTKHLTSVAVSFRIEIQQTTEYFSNEKYIYDFCKRISKYQFGKFTCATLVNEIVSAAATVMGLDKKTANKLSKEVELRTRYGGLIRDMTEQERKEATPIWAREFVVVTGMTNDVRFASISNPFDPETGPVVISNDRFNAENVKYKSAPGEDLAVLAREYYDLPQVHTIKFDPFGETIFTDRTGKKCLNTFLRNESFYYGQAHAFTPTQLEIRNQLEKFTNFFMPDEVQRQILLNYIAHNIFNIGHKVQWAPFIVTTEGYGKDTFIHLFEIALGKYRKHFLKIEGFKFFDPQWTSLLEHRSFVHVNEVYAAPKGKNTAASDRDRVFNMIKDRITDADSMRISTKYQTDRLVQQSTNYSFTSNSKDGITFPSSERRLFVLWPERHHENPLESKQEIQPTVSYIWNLLHTFGIGGNTRIDLTSPTHNSARDLARESILSFFGPYAQKENWHKEFRPSGEAYRTKEFYEMSDLGRDMLHETIDDLIEDISTPYVTDTYICLNALSQLVFEKYRRSGYSQFPQKAEMLIYLHQLGYSDIMNARAVHTDDSDDFKPDIARVFDGTISGKSKLYIHRYQVQQFQSNTAMNSTTFLRKLFLEWETKIKFKELAQAEADNIAQKQLKAERQEQEQNSYIHDILH